MVPRDYVDEVISSLFEDAVDPKISVVGVGGAGGRMVSALYDREMKGVEVVAVNTDPAGLSKAACDVKVLLPHTEDEDRIAAARASAESQEPELRASLSSDIVVVVDNNSLDRFADQLSFNEAMQVVSYMVVTIVQGVVDHLS